MPRQCEHCDNPDKAAWQQRCLYKGSYPSRRAFVLSTFDAPCAMDAYDDRVEERRQRNRPMFLAVWTVAGAFGVFLLWMGLR